jgi:hypothetical protein
VERPPGVKDEQEMEFEVETTVGFVETLFCQRNPATRPYGERWNALHAKFIFGSPRRESILDLSDTVTDRGPHFFRVSLL